MKRRRNTAEANVQAEFYHQCRLLGLNCELEMSTPVGRLDCAILSEDADRLLCIIECKREDRLIPMWETRQIKRYKTIGVPVHYLCSFSECEAMVRHIIAAKDPGKPMSEVMQTKRIKRARFGRKRIRSEGKTIILDADLNYKTAASW